jgi:predicted transcriptional regulator
VNQTPTEPGTVFLCGVLAEIRHVTGVGNRPMLTELATAIKAAMQAQVDEAIRQERKRTQKIAVLAALMGGFMAVIKEGPGCTVRNALQWSLSWFYDPECSKSREEEIAEEAIGHFVRNDVEPGDSRTLDTKDKKGNGK